MCMGCEARRSEIEWLRGQVETLQSKVVAMSDARSGYALSASEATRISSRMPQTEDEYAPSLPPSVEEACLSMAGGDGKLYGELAAWASSQLIGDGSNAEEVADMIYVGRQEVAV